MDLAQQLQLCLEKYSKQAQQLMQLLQSEQQALQTDDQAALNELTQQKQHLLTDFLQADRSFVDIISKSNNPNHQTLNDVINDLDSPKQSQLTTLWKKLKQSIEETLNLNAINGIALSNRINAIRHTLSILTTGDANESIVSYDANGGLESATRSTGQSKA